MAFFKSFGSVSGSVIQGNISFYFWIRKMCCFHGKTSF